MQSLYRFAPLRTVSLLGIGALSSLLGLTASRPAAAQGYTFTTITSADLGTPGSLFNEAAGITNAGVVVGNVGVVSDNGKSLNDGYEYDTSSGAVTLLNYKAANGGSEFRAVSGDGLQVLGDYYPVGNGALTYFTDSGGHISTLPDPYALTHAKYAGYYGINSSGTTVGDFSTSGGNYQGFLRGADGTLTTFSDPNHSTGSIQAEGINASGTVAGQSTTYDAATQSYKHDSFLRSANGTFTDFTVPGATDTYLFGLSDNGNLFGAYDVYDAAGKFVTYDNFTDVGGVFDTSVDVPGAQSTYVTGINDAGQISGYYYDASGNVNSFYGNFNPVPEASSVVSFGLLLMLGGAVVIARRKKSMATA